MFETNLAPSTPSHLAFTGNPIIMRDDFDLSTQVITGYPFSIELNGMTIYTGRFNYPYVINIADIIDSYADYLPEPQEQRYVNSGPLIRIESLEEFERRHVFVQFNGEYDRELEFYALPGGISKQNFRQLSGMPDCDIFTRRFLAKDTNCFLTTRTNNWNICIKETEIYPLYYINDNWDDEFTIVEKMTGLTTTIDCIDPGVYALDIDRLRRILFNEYGILSNCFEIYHKDKLACRVVIEQADNSRNRCRIKFRNSLGVFEIIELTGELSVTPEWENTDDTIYNSYDSRVNDYISARERVRRKHKLSVNTGIKHKNEISFLMDMLSSDEVYLLDMSPLPVKVIPTVEEFSFKHRPETPQTFNITLEMVEEDIYISQDITDTTDFHKPRVFAKQFCKQFN